MYENQIARGQHKLPEYFSKDAYIINKFHIY